MVNPFRRKLTVQELDLPAWTNLVGTYNAGPMWGYPAKRLVLENVSWEKHYDPYRGGLSWELTLTIRPFEPPLWYPVSTSDWNLLAASQPVEEPPYSKRDDRS